jgi:hypothetical protein
MIQMALPANRPLSEASVSAYLADVSAASSTFVAAPFRGTIKRAYSAISVALTGADCTWSMKINGTAVTGSSTTITQSGSAAGDVDSCTPTAANYVNEGDTIEFVSDGASTTTCPTTFVVVIERD